MSPRTVFLAVSAGVLTLAAAAYAGSAGKPHPHQGVLKPYAQLPPPKLAPADLSTLDAGRPIRRQTEGDAGGRGLAIFRVAAAPETVWSVIGDFPSYPKWIDNVSRTDVYKRDGENIYVAFRLSGLGFSIDYFIHHVYHDAQQWGTWTLDYSRESDLDDSVGFWRVTPVEGKPGWSTVEYSVDVQLRGWLPGFIRGIIVDKGLRQATEWVKVQAEARQKARARQAGAATAPAAAGAP
ncbi:MAG: SRPBCC family protein [Deltaproteobacteria bacterium]|nr:SRPBCC family protein [Deltaproteobacteria bacterium]